MMILSCPSINGALLPTFSFSLTGGEKKGIRANQFIFHSEHNIQSSWGLVKSMKHLFWVRDGKY